MGFVQILSDEIATSLKSTALVAYLVRVILLNVSVRRRHWLIDGGHTLVGFLPVCSTEEGWM